MECRRLWLGDTAVSHTALEKRALSLWKTHGTRTFLFGVHEHDRAAAEKWLVSKRCWTVDGDVSSRRKCDHFTGLSERADMLQYFLKKKGPAPFDTTWAPHAMPKLVEKAKNPVGRPVITVITPKLDMLLVWGYLRLGGVGGKNGV